MALTVITRPRVLRRFLTFDLEWIPGEKIPEGPALDVHTKEPVSLERTRPLRLRIFGVYDGERYRSYRSTGEFLANELTRANRGAWFYAHAGGLSDIEFVFDEILKWNDAATTVTLERPGTSGRTTVLVQKRGKKLSTRYLFRLKASFSGSSAIIVHVARGKNSFHFIDSYWLLRDKLKNIGKAIGLPKLGEEKRSTRSETLAYFRDTPLSELEPYNERDCVILWRAINEFESALLEAGGQLQMTIAGSAMHLFRRKFLKRDIETSGRVNDAARQAYFASRVEVYNRFAEDFWVYDINSSFPYAMTFPCPAEARGSRQTLPDSDDESCIYLADVLIDVPDMYLPPVPFRIGGRVFFPTGRWRTWLDSTDIRLLLREGGRVLKVYDVIEFSPFTDLKDYAEAIYERRKAEKHEFGRLVYKYLLNSLYGKFAESPWKQAMLINPRRIRRQADPENGKKAMRMYLPGVWQDEVKVPVAHMHVPISVHITAIARRTQYDFIKIPLNAGEEVHYTDTDSLATPAILPTSNELGALKLEKKMDEMIFAAPKVYAGSGREMQKDGTWKEIQIARAKGFSLPEDPREARDMLDKVIEGGEIEFQRMARLREIYGSGTTEPVEVVVRKALRGLMLSKRFPYPDGSSRPWTVEELRSGDYLEPFSQDEKEKDAERIDDTDLADEETA